jgi:formate dehydrogenase iron-sulfur subunit
VPATIYVPCDSAAASVGADDVAAAIASAVGQRRLDVRIVRNGSRGMFWLEPLVEVATPAGRTAYGPVAARDVAGLFDAGFLEGGAHALRLGPTEDIPYLKNQERLTFARVGITDPRSLADYEQHGGWRGLRAAIAMPGTFSDRMIMEGDPFVLIEGMAIAALAVGATLGYIYVRSEYPDAERTLRAAIAAARQAGFLGDSVLGSGKRFELDVRRGAGAYICGEETAMLDSLEGKRGMVRPKPPLPAIAGLFGKPTVINNVITLASVPIILDRGARFYADYAWAGRAARCRSSSPATSSTAAWSRRRSASPCAS